MALPIPPELTEDALLAGSVVDPPRSGFARLMDLVIGRTPEERMMGVGGLAGFHLLRPTAAAAQAIPRADIGHGVRAIGRDALNWIKAHTRIGVGRPLTLDVRDIGKGIGPVAEQGALEPVFSRIVLYPETIQRAGTQMKDVLAHEVAHVADAAAGMHFQPVGRTVREVMGFERLRPVLARLRKWYDPEDLPAELYARSLERTPELVGGREAQAAINQAARTMRGRMRAMLRDPAYQAKLAEWARWIAETREATP